MQLIGRMRKERFMAAFSAAIVLAILVTACGGSDPTATPVPPATATPVPQATDASVPQATDTPVPQATDTPVPPATATPVPQATDTPAPPSPNRGGVFRTQDVGIPHLDPTIIDVSGQANFLDVIYDGLLTMRANDYNDFAVIGQLASSWTVSADGTEYTFQLQENVNWQNVEPVNGRAFTSADVGWLIDWSKENEPGKTFNFYKNIVSWDAPDDYTIVIKAEKPLAEFLPQLASPETKMLPRELLEQQEGDVTLSQRLAIGTGPFMFGSLDRGVSVAAESNPNYWQASADGEALPYLDGWESYTMKDYAARLAALRTKQVDRWYWPGGISVDDAKDLEASDSGWVIKKDLFVVAPNLSVNVQLPPFDDIRVRQALAYAVNRQQIIDVRFKGEALLSFYVNPARQEWAWTQEQIAERFPYDPDRAKALLAEAGYDDQPVQFVFYQGASPGFDQQTAEIVIEFMRQVGFNVETDVVPDYAAMSARMNAGQAPVNLNASYGHTTGNQLYSWYHSSSPTNWLRVNDPALDALLDQEQATVDADERSKIVVQIVEIIANNFYSIPNVTPLAFRADAEWVNGLEQNRISGNYHRERVWIDPSKK